MPTTIGSAVPAAAFFSLGAVPQAATASSSVALIASPRIGVADHPPRAILRLWCFTIGAPVQGADCRNRLRRVSLILCGPPHRCQVAPQHPHRWDVGTRGVRRRAVADAAPTAGSEG